MKTANFVWGLYGDSLSIKIQYKQLTGTYRCEQESLREKNYVFKDATQKSARVVVSRFAMKLQPREPIFIKKILIFEKTMEGGVPANVRRVIKTKYGFNRLTGDTNFPAWWIFKKPTVTFVQFRATLKNARIL